MQDIKISYLHATFKEKKKLCVKRMRSRNTKSKCDTFKVTSNMLNAKKKKRYLNFQQVHQDLLNILKWLRTLLNSF